MPHNHSNAVLQYDEQKTITLGTLATKTAIQASTIVDSNRENGFWLKWVKIAGYLSGKTATEGPITYGIACNLTAAELTDILNDDPQNSQVVTKTGKGSWYRPITLFGVDETEGDVNGGQGSTNVQAQSRYSKYNVNWVIPEGSGFFHFAFNHDSGTLTTGALIKVSTQFFGAWLRD